VQGWMAVRGGSGGRRRRRFWEGVAVEKGEWWRGKVAGVEGVLGEEGWGYKKGRVGKGRK